MTNPAQIRLSPAPAEPKTGWASIVEQNGAKAALRIAVLIAVAVFAAIRLHRLGWATIVENLPNSAANYACFAAGYFMLPMFDPIIYARLWDMKRVALVPVMF